MCPVKTNEDPQRPRRDASISLCKMGMSNREPIDLRLVASPTTWATLKDPAIGVRHTRQDPTGEVRLGAWPRDRISTVRYWHGEVIQT